MTVIGVYSDVYTANIHSLDIEQSLKMLDTDATYGLSEEEAAARLAQSKQGKQKNKKQKTRSTNIPDQLKDFFVYLLLAVCILAAILGEGLIDAILIFFILTASVIVSTFQKKRVSSTLREAKKRIDQSVKVKRDGRILDISNSDLVVGDIVYFDRGDIIPADLRIIDSNKLLVDEISITGEDDWVRKEANSVLDVDTALSDRDNLAFMGSIVTFGRGAGVVYAVGPDTEKGRRKVFVSDKEETTTHLQIELNKTARSFGVLFLIVCALTLAIGILYDFFDIGYGHDIFTLLAALLALIVASSPKGIGNAAANIMASGVRKMVKSRNIVKNLRSALNLGSTAVICTSKTGVLTKNIMTITRVSDSENDYEVTGVGYKPQGHVAAEIMITRNIALMSEIVVLCNNATYDKDNAQIFGDPTEGAMLVFGAKLGHDKDILNTMRPRIQEKPFDSGRKIMSTFNMDGDRVIMYTKGAAEEVIARSSYVYLDGEIVFMSDTIRAKLLAGCDNYASQALRVMACAYKVYDDGAQVDFDESDLIYVGTMGLMDPLRDALKSSIRQCIDAGLDVKLITGDHSGTAKAIAFAFGIADVNDEVIEGRQIDDMADDELAARVTDVHVFARVSPAHKMRIVTALQTQTDSKVAVTGVDIDDVPALRKADIGIAMGHSSKDIVKETADVILGDDNLAGLVETVEEGKAIFANIKKGINYVLTYKLAMLLIVFFAVVFGLALPLTGPLLLLISLIMNALIVPAIGMEPKEPGVLARRIKNPEESVISRKVITSVITRAVTILICTMAVFLYGLYVVIAPDGVAQHNIAMGMCFFTIITTIVLLSYSAKTDASIISGGVLINNWYVNISVVLAIALLTAVIYIPGSAGLFSIYTLSPGQITISLLLVIIAVVVCEVFKNSTRHYYNKGTGE